MSCIITYNGQNFTQEDFLDYLKSQIPTSINNPSDFTNHSGGAYGGDTYWDLIGREFGVTNHKHYKDAGNANLSQQLRNKGVKAEILTKEQMDFARQKVKELLGITYNDDLKGNLQVRNFYQVYNADAVYAVAKINNDNKSVSGGTNTAIQLGIKLGKPVYVWDINSETWNKFEPNLKDFLTGKTVSEFYEIETPTLTKNFAGIGSRDIENYNTLDKTTNKWTPRKEYLGDEKAQKAQQAIRDVYEKTFNQSEQGSKQEIKPGVEELFESNPKLANEVYEALGVKPKADIILPIGTSGSGKSTFIKSLPQENLVVIEPDAMRVEFTGDMNDKSKDKEIYEEAAKRAVTAIKQGKQVVFDTTNLTKDKRLPFIEAIKKEIPNANIQYKLMELNPELAKQRIKADIAAGKNRAAVSDATIDRHAESYKQMLEDIKSEPISNFEITPQQKQQAQQLYSEYLDSLNTIELHSKLGNKTESGNVTVVKNIFTNKDDKDVITAFRVDKKLGLLESFRKYNAIGNPINWQGFKPRFEGDNATIAFMDWFLGKDYTDVEQEYRQEILNNLDNLKGKTIEYYKELGRPSHATALDYLINQLGSKQDIEGFKNWVDNNQSNVQQDFNTPTDIDNFAEEAFECK